MPFGITSKKILGFLLVFSFLSFLPIQALAAGIDIPFGGIVIKPVWCPCSANFAIRIIPIGATPPPPIILMYQPGVTTLYAFWNILKPGTYLLGTYSPVPIPCLSIVFCIPDPRVLGGGPLIRMVGTSQ